MPIDPDILEQAIAAAAEPLIIVRVDHPDWPVALCNHAFESIRGEDCREQPFADVTATPSAALDQVREVMLIWSQAPPAAEVDE